MDVVITSLNIHLGKVFGALQFVNKGGDEWEGIGIFNCMFIEITVVLTRAESSVLLLNEEEWRSLR